MIHQLRAHDEQSGSREYVQSETGVRTLREEFTKVNEGHWPQIAKALQR